MILRSKTRQTTFVPSKWTLRGDGLLKFQTIKPIRTSEEHDLGDKPILQRKNNYKNTKLIAVPICSENATATPPKCISKLALSRSPPPPSIFTMAATDANSWTAIRSVLRDVACLRLWYSGRGANNFLCPLARLTSRTIPRNLTRPGAHWPCSPRSRAAWDFKSPPTERAKPDSLP